MKECKIVKSILAGRVASFPGLETRPSTSQSTCAGRVVRIPGAFLVEAASSPSSASGV